MPPQGMASRLSCVELRLGVPIVFQAYPHLLLAFPQNLPIVGLEIRVSGAVKIPGE